MSTGMVTAISAKILVDECTRCGVDRKDLQAAIPGNHFDELSGRVPVESMYVLWDRAVRLTADPMFAVRVAGRAPFGAYRLLDYLLALSSSPRDALNRSCRCFSLLNTALALSLRLSGDLAYLELFSSDRQQGVPRPYVEYLLAIFLFRLRFATQAYLTPLELHFTHGQSALAGQYHRIFGAQAKFHQSVDRLVFSRHTMDVRHRFADPELCEVLQGHADHKLNAARPGQSLVTEVQQILQRNIETGAMTLAAVSRQLAKSTRSLQREIYSSGTSFRELLDSAREKHARGLLKDPNLTLAEIARRLHFSDASSFCRTFQRWTGHSPSRYRDN